MCVSYITLVLDILCLFSSALFIFVGYQIDKSFRSEIKELCEQLKSYSRVQSGELLKKETRTALNR